jgi:hypothetical protein
MNVGKQFREVYHFDSFTSALSDCGVSIGRFLFSRMEPARLYWIGSVDTSALAARLAYTAANATRHDVCAY